MATIKKLQECNYAIQKNGTYIGVMNTFGKKCNVVTYSIYGDIDKMFYNFIEAKQFISTL